LALDDHLHPWIGSALRHVSTSHEADPLDFSWAGRSSLNRWNGQGQPTLYLAGDEGVMITEWGRHFTIQAAPGSESRTQQRRVLRFHLAIDHILDLRDRAIWDELSLDDAPTCFLSIDIARATSDFIRTTSTAQGIIVPPVGLLDHPERWNLVLFLEKLPEPARFITNVTPMGTLQRG
jgi:RES domain-containing protein